MDREQFKQRAKEIAEVGLHLAQQGWSPSTSSNYSARLDEETMAITRSGVDKFTIKASDVIVTDMNAQALETDWAKPSAESLIHTCIYKKRPKAQAVLHTHSVLGTRLSLKYSDEGRILVSGYELLKGLAGNTTHEMTEEIPIIPNEQDMQSFSEKLESLLDENKNIHGFLIAGHGLYTWGADLLEAKRHIESFEFLFECLQSELNGI